MWIYLFFALGLGLLLLPLLPAMVEWWHRSSAYPLSVNPVNDGNIENFSKRFNTFINQLLTAIKQGDLTPEQLDKYLFSDSVTPFMPSSEEAQQHRINRVVIATHTTELPAGYRFTREIFAKCSLVGGSNTILRAALVHGNFELEANSAILRWAHASQVKLGPACAIFGRLSAVERITLTSDCTFKRLHAPTILFCDDHDEMPRPDSDVEIDASHSVTPEHVGRWLIKEDFHIPAGTQLRGDVIAHGNLSIGSNSIIEGNIKCYGNLSLMDGVNIKGALTSEKQLQLGEQCRVSGPLIVEGGIEIGTGTVIGQRQHATTVTANTIKVANRVVAHGTLWARQGGAAKLQYDSGEFKHCVV